MRLRAGYTIDQAAQSVDVGRQCVMNYALGRVKGMKKDTVAKLCELYDKRKLLNFNVAFNSSSDDLSDFAASSQSIILTVPANC